jgi:hypothetical protein
VASALRDHPAVIEHIGDIEQFEIDFIASVVSDTDIYTVTGSRGEGTIGIQMDSWLSSDIRWAKLHLSDGTEINLVVTP